MHAVRATRRADRRGPETPGAGPAGSSEEIRHGLKEIQYHPRLIECCLAGTGLTPEQTENPPDIMN
jgi:hypothetical protein